MPTSKIDGSYSTHADGQNSGTAHPDSYSPPTPEENIPSTLVVPVQAHTLPISHAILNDAGNVPLLTHKSPIPELSRNNVEDPFDPDGCFAFLDTNDEPNVKTTPTHVYQGGQNKSDSGQAAFHTPKLQTNSVNRACSEPAANEAHGNNGTEPVDNVIANL